MAVKSLVVCVGLQKTGTTSLTKALEILGYRTAHYLTSLLSDRWYGVREFAPQDKVFSLDPERMVKALEPYDAVTDSPVSSPEVFSMLDQQFPGTKFIYTTRDLPSWMKSVERHNTMDHFAHQLKGRIETYKDYDPDRDYVFSCDSIGITEYLYRTPYKKLTPDVYAEAYLQHQRQVEAYFEKRQEDLLVLNVAEEGQWEKLCVFLGKEVPRKKFPHQNKTDKNGWERAMDGVMRFGRRYTPQPIKAVVKKAF